LIEWFFEYPHRGPDRYTPGGDFMHRVLPKYDRHKGRLHNFTTVRRILGALAKDGHLDKQWMKPWTTMLAFDALIGNTDRHQDNWGVIWNFPRKTDLARGRLAPAFDNGTSMGHEIQSVDLDKFQGEHLCRYVLRGTHHMKWGLLDEGRMGHLEFLKRLCSSFPASKRWMVAALKKVSPADIEKIAHGLTEYDVPVRFSESRAKFVVRLLTFRHQWILEGLA